MTFDAESLTTDLDLRSLGERVYLKAEYRRYFDFVDFNAAIIGVGMSF